MHQQAALQAAGIAGQAGGAANAAAAAMSAAAGLSQYQHPPHLAAAMSALQPAAVPAGTLTAGSHPAIAPALNGLSTNGILNQHTGGQPGTPTPAGTVTTMAQNHQHTLLAAASIANSQSPGVGAVTVAGQTIPNAAVMTSSIPGTPAAANMAAAGPTADQLTAAALIAGGLHPSFSTSALAGYSGRFTKCESILKILEMH